MKTSKLFGSSALLVFLLMLSASCFAQKTNFSGTWKFNESKSQLGEGRFRMAPSKIKLAQNDSVILADLTRQRPTGEEMTSTEKYTLNGKECDNSVPAQNRTKKSIITFSADGKIMTIASTSAFERDGNRMEFKSTEIYKLSDDGKTLTINNTTNSTRGEFKTSLVYDKAD
jgi:hypothetical protein